ncbi:MAG: hypothetical protein ACK4G1_03420 [Ignavibacteria bacterium]
MPTDLNVLQLGVILFLFNLNSSSAALAEIQANITVVIEHTIVVLYFLKEYF